MTTRKMQDLNKLNIIRIALEKVEELIDKMPWRTMQTHAVELECVEIRRAVEELEASIETAKSYMCPKHHRI